VLAFVTTWDSRTSGAMCGMRAAAAAAGGTIVGKGLRQPGRAGSQPLSSLQLSF